MDCKRDKLNIPPITPSAAPAPTMSQSPPTPQSSPQDGPPDIMALAEVRYSLPELLAELRLERTTGSFAMERLNQFEIGKLFQDRQKRRAKPKR